MSSLAHDNSKLLYLVNNSGASSIGMKSEIKTMFLSRVLSLGYLLFWGNTKNLLHTHWEDSTIWERNNGQLPMT